MAFSGKVSIPPAAIVRNVRHIVTGPFMVTEYLFSVPLDYSNPTKGQIQLFARSATKYEPSTVGPGSNQQHSQRPWLVYLQGGPGFGCPEPQDSSLTRFVINKGYQILYLDYRGVGLSSPLTVDTIPNTTSDTVSGQVAYMKLFRQDNNVRDLESVRQALTASLVDPLKRKWSIFGQSFGGFVALTYLSQYPEGLREVFMTGGLAPITRAPREVYQSTFNKICQRNKAYYDKFPEDIQVVHRVARWLYSQDSGSIELPAGGRLSPRRLLTLGHMFGFHGGLDNVHAMLLRMDMDLAQYKRLTRPTLAQFETYLPFDTCPIYAVLHEAIYCHRAGVASNWAAQHVGQEHEHFRWLSDDRELTNALEDESKPLYFTGEMIFPFMFNDYPELGKLKAAAQRLAEYDQWDDLYDEQQLTNNEVPVFAASYIDDMYVDYDLARETASKVNGIKTFETNSSGDDNEDNDEDEDKEEDDDDAADGCVYSYLKRSRFLFVLTVVN
ncbi:hypothetical protein N0V82_003233 [Gnomoniopsis sp. IMI 355080]|nr:hypothetical protein N0V82_003233 [Gnomoniopsis sp. IMI 355080]